jgi:Chitin binding Peritrophin-A domain
MEKEMFPDPVQCDKYYECVNGTSTEKLCPDGLVFDKNITRFFKCDHPFKVDCGKRTELQPAQKVSEFCPRRNGVFYHPDLTLCDMFYTCDEGIHSIGQCVDGLHFYELSGECVWPHIPDRQNCKEKKLITEDGFSCPKVKKKDKHGTFDRHPHYEHPTHCQKFYVCLNGDDPRLLTCEEPTEVFNPQTTSCDLPKNVPGCEDWFD